MFRATLPEVVTRSRVRPLPSSRRRVPPPLPLVVAMQQFTANHDTFYLTDDQIADSPSRRAGMDEETEFRLKVYGCELVQEAAVLLRAEQAVACTGQVLLHRFYAKRSLTKFDVERVAATMVFLACKLEECPRRLREVINVFHRMTCRRRGAPLEPLHHLGQEYEDIKQDLIRTERHALREFGFCIHVEHPHKFVLNYLRMFELGKDVMQRAWNYANDSLRTSLCVRFRADAVAAACVHLAARTENVGLPEDPPWWSLFQVTEDGLRVMSESILALYEMLPPGGGKRATYVDVAGTGAGGGFATGADQAEPRAEPARREDHSRAREDREMEMTGRREETVTAIVTLIFRGGRGRGRGRGGRRREEAPITLARSTPRSKPGRSTPRRSTPRRSTPRRSTPRRSTRRSARSRSKPGQETR